MDTYRTNILNMLPEIQILYQNQRISKEKKDELINLMKTGVENISDRIRLGEQISGLLKIEMDPVFINAYQNILQYITIQK